MNTKRTQYTICEKQPNKRGRRACIIWHTRRKIFWSCTKRRNITMAMTDLGVLCIDFFSSRRRHTRYWRDWSSDVCSSDLQTAVHVHGDEVDEQAQRELESLAAGLKVAQTAHATRTIQMCREACGGAGYLQENRLPHLKADTDVFTTFEGDNTVLLQLVAKGLLTGYRDAFGSLEGWGKVGFIADMVRETVLERTAARDRKSTRLNSSHANISYAVFCLKKKKNELVLTKPNYTIFSD